MAVLFPKNRCAAAVDNANVCAGVVVAVATEVVNNGERFPLLKLVTVPLPLAGVPQLNTVPLVVKNLPEFVACAGKSLKSEVAGCVAVNNPVTELYEFIQLDATDALVIANCGVPEMSE